MTVEAPKRVFTDGILVAVLFIITFIYILAVFYAGIFTCQTSFTLTLIKPMGIFTYCVQSTCGHSCFAFIFVWALQRNKKQQSSTKEPSGVGGVGFPVFTYPYTVYLHQLITDIGVRIPVTGIGIPCQWNLDSGFQSLLGFRFSDFQILLFFHYLHIDYIGILICKSTLGNNVRNKCVVTKVANASGLVTATYVKLADIDT